MLNEVLAVNRQRRIAAVRKKEGITVFSWEGPVAVEEGDLIQGASTPLQERRLKCWSWRHGVRMMVRYGCCLCREARLVMRR
jgi:hypothetical protein